jgi:hypothetical protein
MYYTQTARHPRAGIAAGLAILVAWVGLIGVAAATDDSPDGGHSAAPAGRTVDAPDARPGRAGPGYVQKSR